MYDARLTAAIAFCPTKLSITTSAELTAALIRFCKAIGKTIFASDLKNVIASCLWFGSLFNILVLLIVLFIFIETYHKIH